MSADDSARVRVLWEQYYNIQDNQYTKHRASSEPAIQYSLHDTVNSLTSLSIGQSNQPVGISSTISTARTGNTTGTDTTQKSESHGFWRYGNLPWLQRRFLGQTYHPQVYVTPMPGQQDGPRSAKSLPSVERLHHSLESDHLGTGWQNMTRSHLAPYETVLGFMMEILKFLWWIFEWPVIWISTVVIAAMVVVWVVAAFYTLTSNAFLNSFCEMKLPLI